MKLAFSRSVSKGYLKRLFSFNKLFDIRPQSSIIEAFKTSLNSSQVDEFELSLTKCLLLKVVLDSRPINENTMKLMKS